MQPSRDVNVKISALQAGHLTLPERFFVHPASETARRTVPSLSFLVEHTNPTTKQTTRLLFDLGLRHPTSNYPLPIQAHIQGRQPLTTEPDVVESLRKGGLSPEDIDYVVYSHVRLSKSASSTILTPRASDPLGPYRRPKSISQKYIYRWPGDINTPRWKRDTPTRRPLIFRARPLTYSANDRDPT